MIIPDPKLRIGNTADRDGVRNSTGAGLHRHVFKFAGDVLPSVAATVLGAWIVTHYVNTKPETKSAPPAAAAVAQPEEITPKPEPVAAQAPVSLTEPVPPEPAQPAKPDAIRIIPLQQSSSAKPIESSKRIPELPKVSKHEPVKRPAAALAERHQSKPEAETKVEAEARETTTSDAPAAAASRSGASVTNAEPGAAQTQQDALDIARKALDRIKEGPISAPLKTPDRAASEATLAPAPAPPSFPRTEASASPPPLPPAVILARPPAPAAASEGRRSSTQEDPDRPIPPADIPAPSTTQPGFIIVH